MIDKLLVKCLQILERLAQLRKRPTPTPQMPADMRMSSTGLDLVRKWEGCKLKAYLCPAGKWTIGYGHTGPLVVDGLRWTQDTAEAALVDDVDLAAAIVRKHVRVPLTQNQFDALVSLTFNIGALAFRQSTLLSKLNAGNYMAASAEFDKWRMSKGKVLKGLVDRRKAERELFDAT